MVQNRRDIISLVEVTPKLAYCGTEGSFLPVAVICAEELLLVIVL